MFRTEIKLALSNKLINHSQHIMTIGSCFSDAMGAYLQDYKFQVLSNPFGTLFNPISIFQNLEHSLFETQADKNLFIEMQGLSLHYNFHSDLYGMNKKEVLIKITERQAQVKRHLLNANWLMITLGTAWAYKLKGTDKMVANCHKMPQSNFDKKLLEVQEIVNHFNHLLRSLFSFNDKLHIILTVSPVRHVKDTLPHNSVSKSVLRVACHKMLALSNRVHYFPSYELILDDLRDYRFYGRDMIHPNEIAHDYVWDKFSSVYFDKSTQLLNKEWAKIKKSLAHKPLHPQTMAYKSFLKDTQQRLLSISEKLDVKAEIESLKQKLLS